MLEPRDAESPRQPLFTRPFVTVVVAGLAYFLGLGMQLPVLPLFARDELGASKAVVGLIMGTFFVGAVLVRPFAGLASDRHGRRVLLIGGAVIVAASSFGLHLANGIPSLLGIRLLGGVGEAAFFVGAGTMVTDLAPEERRGEAISYWSIAVYGGLAGGPFLGELIMRKVGFGASWTVSGVIGAVAALVGLATRETAPHLGEPVDDIERRLLHPAALLPGTVLLLGLAPLAGYTAFLSTYVRELGWQDSQGVFGVYAGTILAVRILGARLPDTLGPVRAVTVATVVGGSGLVLMAAWHSPAGLIVSTVVYAVGMSLLYPAVLTLTIGGLSAGERGSAVGTVSSFFDLSQALGAPILGVVADAVGFRGAFLVGASLCFWALAILRLDSVGRRRRSFS